MGRADSVSCLLPSFLFLLSFRFAFAGGLMAVAYGSQLMSFTPGCVIRVHELKLILL